MKKPPKKILVGLKDASSAEELVGLACQMAAPARVQVVGLHVLEVPPATPLDAEDEALEAPGRAVEQAVKRLAKKYRRQKIQVRRLRARHAGSALVDELKQGKFDLAVIGYHHKRSLAELILGTTARYLAEHAPCRLLMSIPPRA